jgi:hypothetical protein
MMSAAPVVTKKINPNAIDSDVFHQLDDVQDRLLLANIYGQFLAANKKSHEPHFIKWTNTTHTCLEFYRKSDMITYRSIKKMINIDPSRVERIVVGPSQMNLSSISDYECDGVQNPTTLTPNLRLEVIIRHKSIPPGSKDSAANNDTDEVRCIWSGDFTNVDESDVEGIKEALGDITSMGSRDEIIIPDVAITSLNSKLYNIAVKGLDTINSDFMSKFMIQHNTHCNGMTFYPVIRRYPGSETEFYNAVDMHIQWRKNSAQMWFVNITQKHADTLESTMSSQVNTANSITRKRSYDSPECSSSDESFHDSKRRAFRFAGQDV